MPNPLFSATYNFLDIFLQTSTMVRHLEYHLHHLRVLGLQLFHHSPSQSQLLLEVVSLRDCLEVHLNFHQQNLHRIPFCFRWFNEYCFYIVTIFKILPKLLSFQQIRKLCRQSESFICGIR